MIDEHSRKGNATCLPQALNDGQQMCLKLINQTQKPDGTWNRSFTENYRSIECSGCEWPNYI